MWITFTQIENRRMHIPYLSLSIHYHRHHIQPSSQVLVLPLQRSPFALEPCVGANDAIMAGLSTFRVELDETALILKHATEKSLVILDELGRGTATFDGMAIAHAVLDHLVKVTKCRALFATHYHALTRAYERPNAAVALYHMACVVDDATRDVTFLYKFTTGACNRSHGVHVARLAGLPAELLAAAEQKSKAMEATLDEIRPYLAGTGGGQLELVDIEDPIVKVRLTGPAASVMTVRVAVTQKLREKMPSIAAVQLLN